MKTGFRPAGELKVGDVVSAKHVIGRVVQSVEVVDEPGVDAVKVNFRPLYEDKPGLVQYYHADEMVRVTREDNDAVLFAIHAVENIVGAYEHLSRDTEEDQRVHDELTASAKRVIELARQAVQR